MEQDILIGFYQINNLSFTKLVKSSYKIILLTGFINGFNTNQNVSFKHELHMLNEIGCIVLI